MNNLTGIFLLGFVLTVLVSVQRSEAVDLRAAGAFTSSTDIISTTTPGVTLTAGSAQSGYGGGILADFPIGPRFTFEVGALYVQRKIEADISASGFTATQDDTFTDIQIPALFEVNVGSFIRVGGGIAYNLASGNVNVDQKDPNNIAGGTFTGKSQTYSQLNNSTSDLAAVADLDFHVPVGKVGVFAGAQYQFGITNIDTSGKQPTKINVLMALAGLSFHM